MKEAYIVLKEFSLNKTIYQRGQPLELTARQACHLELNDFIAKASSAPADGE